MVGWLASGKGGTTLLSEIRVFCGAPLMDTSNCLIYYQILETSRMVHFGQTFATAIAVFRKVPADNLYEMIILNLWSRKKYPSLAFNTGMQRNRWKFIRGFMIMCWEKCYINNIFYRNFGKLDVWSVKLWKQILHWDSTVLLIKRSCVQVNFSNNSYEICV